MKHWEFLLSHILAEGLDVVCVFLLCLIAVSTIFRKCLLIDEVYMQHGGECLAQSHHSKKVPWIPSPGLIYGVYMFSESSGYSSFHLQPKNMHINLILAEMGLTNFNSLLTELKGAELNCS